MEREREREREIHTTVCTLIRNDYVIRQRYSEFLSGESWNSPSLFLSAYRILRLIILAQTDVIHPGSGRNALDVAYMYRIFRYVMDVHCEYLSFHKYRSCATLSKIYISVAVRCNKNGDEYNDE